MLPDARPQNPTYFSVSLEVSPGIAGCRGAHIGSAYAEQLPLNEIN
jgi:hypothetical protein